MLQAAGLPAFQIEGTEIVGPTVGAELRRQAISATLLSMLGITAWIAFRFRVSFAAGSIVATFHDVLVTLAFLAFFRYEMSLNVIAAMLTMVGYSMNDMIVIFDRVRENTRLQRREPLESAINTSLNQTLTRTVITSGTVFMAVLALYLFGGEVLRGFAFTMLIGTIATTYSGWFIAPSLAIMLSKKPTGGSPVRTRRRDAAPDSRAQIEIAAQGPRYVDGSIACVTLLSCGAARHRAGNHRVPACFLHRTSSPGRAGSSGTRIPAFHGDDSARIDPRGRLAVPRRRFWPSFTGLRSRSGGAPVRRRDHARDDSRARGRRAARRLRQVGCCTRARAVFASRSSSAGS